MPGATEICSTNVGIKPSGRAPKPSKCPGSWIKFSINSLRPVAKPASGELQRRRAQTEGRVGIVKNVFLGGRMRGKGFAHRELTVIWTVLTHNLRVLARLRLAAAAEARRAAA